MTQPERLSKQSWCYVLSNANLDDIANTDAPLIVIDAQKYCEFGRDFVFLNKHQVAALKAVGHKVYAYVSIGEAEDYRYYWNRYSNSFSKQRPGNILVAENPDWEGNYAVLFGSPAWNYIIKEYLTYVVEAGFDGVYLDKCDVIYDFPKVYSEMYHNPEAAMGDFVLSLVAHVRSINPKMGVIIQNAEFLIDDVSVLGAVNAWAKEQRYYGADSENIEQLNSTDLLLYSSAYDQKLKNSGVTLFVVEYLNDPVKKAEAVQWAKRDGHSIYISDVEKALDKVGEIY